MPKAPPSKYPLSPSPASAWLITPSATDGRATPISPSTSERSASCAIQLVFSPYTHPRAARPAANDEPTSSQVLLVASGGA